MIQGIPIRAIGWDSWSFRVQTLASTFHRFHRESGRIFRLDHVQFEHSTFVYPRGAVSFELIPDRGLAAIVDPSDPATRIRIGVELLAKRAEMNAEIATQDSFYRNHNKTRARAFREVLELIEAAEHGRPI